MVPSVRRRKPNTGLKVVLVLAVVLFVQVTFGNDLRVHAVAPDFMLLLAICAGFAGGPDEGAVVGFAAGLAGDLFLQNTPFGLSALAYCLTGFGVGWARVNVLRQRILLAPAVCAVGTCIGVALFVVIGYVVGAQQLVAPGQRWLVETAVIEALYAAAFSLPAVVLMAWALASPAASSASLGTVSATGTGEMPPRRHTFATRSRRRHRPRARVR
ncbi:MAG TPA: rod shape-determining protein MreD [Acidimicrobiales bacterium]|nr:rod shape-determining protein MreD [Acidimicrobiales bacterium]